MFDTLSLSFREGLEAVLVVGIILTQLARLERKDLAKFVYIGTGAGVLLSLLAGVLAFSGVQEAGEESGEWLEGLMMLAAAALIAYFLFWLHRNRNITDKIKQQVSQRLSATGLLLLAFLSVFREGFELVVFNMTQVTASAYSVMTTSLVGVALAVVVGIILFRTSLRFNIKWLFTALGVVLVLVGGEMFAEGIVYTFGLEGGVSEEAAEIIEIGALLIYTIPSLYLLLKDEITTRLLRGNKASASSQRS